METKQAVIKCVTAILCVIIICYASILNVDKICDTNKTISQNVAGGGTTVTDVNGEAVQPGSSPASENSETVSDISASETDGAVSVDSVGSISGSSEESGKSGSGPQQNSDSKVPSTPAEVISYYNNAISKAVSGKVGFHKLRYTDNEKLDAPDAVLIFKKYLNQFMSIGDEYKYDKTIAKGNWPERPPMVSSRLTTADVTNATCTKSGTNYNIVINLKDSSGSASKSTIPAQPNAPLDKCGISIGTEDKEEFDHKSADVIYDAVAGTFKNAKISESSSNIIIKATVNPSNGQFVSLKIEWQINATISNILGTTSKASGTSHVVYSDFKY